LVPEGGPPWPRLIVFTVAGAAICFFIVCIAWGVVGAVKRVVRSPAMTTRTKTVLLVASALALAFYWFQLRPASIRASCADRANGNLRVFRDCLHRAGLER
jgi:hypothetical protein